jgi:two-component system NarL family sensor kinase
MASREPRPSRGLPWPLVACAVPALAVALSWAGWLRGGFTLADSADSYLLTNSAMAVTFSAFGALVLAHRPGQRIGLLFVAFGWLYAVSVASLGVRAATSLPASWDRALTVVGITAWIPAVTVVLPLILQLFPDGRVLTPRWRPLALLTVGVGVLAPAIVLTPDALAREPIEDRGPLVPPAAGHVVAAVLPLLVVLALGVLLASVVVLALRCRRSAGAVRAQVLWLLWAIGVVVVANTQRLVTTEGPALFLLTLPLVPAAATIAIVRHQLYDIRVVINRSLVYAALTAGLLGVYLVVVRLAGSAAGVEAPALPALTASALVAIAFSPVRGWLQSGVDRLLYGRRDDRVAVAAWAGVRLGDGLDAVLQAVCEALRLPGAEVVDAGRVVARYGDGSGAEERTQLPVAEGGPAHLVVRLRRGQHRLHRADRAALALVAVPIAVGLHAMRAADGLRESRSRIVAAREEERRRLRRDLHDGLGSALTALTLKADAAHNIRDSDPRRADELVVELRGSLSDAIADVRRLVYDLRPPDLDELGLADALRQRAEQAWRRPGNVFRVAVDVPRPLPPLPAAVEVAAYRIATEAVTNTLRHGDATLCRVSLTVDDALHVEVTDNTSTDSRTNPWRPGVGLRSMAERAAELGGLLHAGPTLTGARVYARLPLEGA